MLIKIKIKSFKDGKKVNNIVSIKCYAVDNCQ